MTYTAIYPDGRREVLLRVPRYRFDWQLDYYLAEPKALPKGTKVLVTAHFDNSPGNKDNPDAKATAGQAFHWDAVSFANASKRLMGWPSSLLS